MPQKPKPKAVQRRLPIGEVLAANLAAQMDATPSLSSPQKLQEVTEVGISSIWRILNQRGSCRLELLDPIADAFGLEVFQLLEPRSRPVPPTEALPKDIMAIAMAIAKLPQVDREFIKQIAFAKLASIPGRTVRR
jgi:hypothetical protein